MLNLITFNRWWDTGRVEDLYLKPYQRPLFFQLKKFLDSRQILLIYGLRRTGKTTLMYQLIADLLVAGVDKKNILYFSFDESVSSLKTLFKNYQEIVLGIDFFKKEKIYVFLDEVQKLPDWRRQLKIFYDLYPNLKLIISGSASLAIIKEAKESLAGRIYDFYLPLLNFSEYLAVLGERRSRLPDIFAFEELKQVYLAKERLAPLLFSYLKKGGFIEIAQEEDEYKIREYAKSILEKIIFSDIALSFKIKQPQLLKTVIELIASNPGFLLDYSKLAAALGTDQRTAADYVFYLQHSLLIKLLYNYSGSRFVSERKLKKIYLTSTNFIYQIFPERFQEPQFLGKVIENLVVAFLPTQFFWRQRQAEIDLIWQEKIPLEIKYQKQVAKTDLREILKFCQRFKTKRALVLTQERLEKKEIAGIEFLLIPVWLFLLQENSHFGKKN